MDAKVWAYTELFLQDETQIVHYQEPYVISPY